MASTIQKKMQKFSLSKSRKKSYDAWQCVLFDNMNCFAWIRTAADLSLIDDCVRSDEKALGGHPRFGERSPTAGQERARWTIIGMNFRHNIRFTSVLDGTSGSTFESEGSHESIKINFGTSCQDNLTIYLPC